MYLVIQAEDPRIRFSDRGQAVSCVVWTRILGWNFSSTITDAMDKWFVEVPEAFKINSLRAGSDRARAMYPGHTSTLGPDSCPVQMFVSCAHSHCASDSKNAEK
jgi:hypothetical protein